MKIFFPSSIFTKFIPPASPYRHISNIYLLKVKYIAVASNVAVIFTVLKKHATINDKALFLQTKM